MREVFDRLAPLEVLNEAGRSEIVLLCEHAASYIPVEYHGLSLPEEQLQRHIAWDIGAADVIRRLSQLLDAPAFLGTYSRLLIDLNRPLEAPDSMPSVSEGVTIPGNLDLDAEERASRVEALFEPFHRRVTMYLDERSRRSRPTRLVSIHSFTPVFFGIARPWHAGVLFMGATEFANSVLSRLQGSGLLVEANVPYKTDRLGDYAIPIHGDDRDIPAIMLEIRNDLIGEPAGVEDWAQRIARAL